MRALIAWKLILVQDISGIVLVVNPVVWFEFAEDTWDDVGINFMAMEVVADFFFRALFEG